MRDFNSVWFMYYNVFTRFNTSDFIWFCLILPGQLFVSHNIFNIKDAADKLQTKEEEEGGKSGATDSERDNTKSVKDEIN
jgi:hypothetical protein